MKTSAQAFLFDSQAEGVPSSYGDYFDRAFLQSLSAADPDGVTFSDALQGDVLIASLCERTTAVSAEPRRTSHTVSYDMDLYRTVIWDLADAIPSQWNTLDLYVFPMTLARRGVCCITLPTLPINFRHQIDTALRATGGYLGSLEIDLGNPIQVQLFMDMLCKDAVISGGTVTMELGLEGDPDTSFGGASTFLPGGERRVRFGGLNACRPPKRSAAPLSKRGRESAERYAGKRTYSVQERVLAVLKSLPPPRGKQRAFAFEASSSSPTVLEAELKEAKFVQYLLDPQHKDGGSKAKFFRDILGIGPNDWRHLAEQFYEGLKRADPAGLYIKGWADGFSANFSCEIPVSGLNGRTAMVKTTWTMEPGRIPHLSSAYPAEPKPNAVAPPSNVVPSSLKGGDRWEAIYQLANKAGQSAAEQCVPTPMSLSDGTIIMEGACGSASVHIADARRGFARSVIKSGIGDHHHQSGAVIFAMHDSQSVDRAVAYARAFASILQLNGVDCTVDSRLD